MIEYGIDDVVGLHLLAYDDTDNDPAPYARSTPGIMDAMGIETDSVADRISLLSTLKEMVASGRVDERVGPVENEAEDRNVYSLTESGQTGAERFRDQLAREQITVKHADGEQRIALQDDDPATLTSVITALINLSADGSFYLDVGEDAFVDRAAELSSAMTAVESVTNGQGHLLVVRGEAGVGKTRLLDELEERLTTDGSVRWFESRCRGSALEPYQPIQDAIGGPLADVLGEDPFAASSDVEGGGIEENVFLTEPSDGEAPFEAHRRTLFYRIQEGITGLTAGGPVTLVLDDVHNADQPTVDLISALSEALSDEPVLLIVAYRNEAVDNTDPLADFGLGARDHATVLDLEPLTEDGVAALACDRLGRDSVPETFVSILFEKTAGNPLFVTETITQLLDDDRLNPLHDEFPSDPDDIDTPDRVQSVIEDRLAVLDDDGRRLVELAAVIGETVPLSVLAATADLPEPDLWDYVDLLADTRICTRSEEELRFTGSLFRESVLAGLDGDRAQSLHARIGDHLVEVADEDAHASAAAIAHHYSKAGKPDGTLQYARVAARVAEEVYAYEVAIDHYRTALEAARELGAQDDAHDLLLRIGRAHVFLGNHDEATSYFEYVRERTSDAERKQAVWYYRSRIAYFEGDQQTCIEYADRGLEYGGDDPSEHNCKLLDLKGRALRNQGALEEAAAVFEREYAVAKAIGDEERRAEALDNKAIVALYGGDLESARSMIDEAAEAADAVGDLGVRGKVSNDKGIVLARTGEYDAAHEAFERAVDYAEESGNQVIEHLFRTNLAEMEWNRGNWDRALDAYETVSQQTSTLGQPKPVPLAMAGQIRFQRGDLDRGRSFIEQALAVTDEGDRARIFAKVHIAAADLAAIDDDLDRMETHVSAAIDALEDVDPALCSVAVVRRGRLEQRRGDDDAASDTFETALELATAADDDRALSTANTAVSLVATAQNRLEDALIHADRAIEHASALGSPFHLAEANRARAVATRAAGEFERAHAALETGLELAGELDARLLECSLTCERVLVHRAGGEHEHATEALERARDIVEETGAIALQQRCADLTVEEDAHH